MLDRKARGKKDLVSLLEIDASRLRISSFNCSLNTLQEEAGK